MSIRPMHELLHSNETAVPFSREGRLILSLILVPKSEPY